MLRCFCSLSTSSPAFLSGSTPTQALSCFMTACCESSVTPAWADSPLRLQKIKQKKKKNLNHFLSIEWADLANQIVKGRAELSSAGGEDHSPEGREGTCCTVSVVTNHLLKMYPLIQVLILSLSSTVLWKHSGLASVIFIGNFFQIILRLRRRGKKRATTSTDLRQL